MVLDLTQGRLTIITYVNAAYISRIMNPKRAQAQDSYEGHHKKIAPFAVRAPEKPKPEDLRSQPSLRTDHAQLSGVSF